jgi:hypothetical protein
MTKKLCCLDCVPNKQFLSKDEDIFYRLSQDTYQQKKNHKLLAQIVGMQLLVHHWHMELWNMTKKLCH